MSRDPLGRPTARSVAVMDMATNNNIYKTASSAFVSLLPDHCGEVAKSRAVELPDSTRSACRTLRKIPLSRDASL